MFIRKILRIAKHFAAPYTLLTDLLRKWIAKALGINLRDSISPDGSFTSGRRDEVKPAIASGMVNRFVNKNLPGSMQNYQNNQAGTVSPDKKQPGPMKRAWDQIMNRKQPVNSQNDHQFPDLTESKKQPIPIDGKISPEKGVKGVKDSASSVVKSPSKFTGKITGAFDQWRNDRKGYHKISGSGNEGENAQ